MKNQWINSMIGLLLMLLLALPAQGQSKFKEKRIAERKSFQSTSVLQKDNSTNSDNNGDVLRGWGAGDEEEEEEEEEPGGDLPIGNGILYLALLSAGYWTAITARRKESKC